jgi:hypothetical protein
MFGVLARARKHTKHFHPLDGLRVIYPGSIICLVMENIPPCHKESGRSNSVPETGVKRIAARWYGLLKVA